MLHVITCLSHLHMSACKHIKCLESDVKLVLPEVFTGMVNLLSGWQLNLLVQAE